MRKLSVFTGLLLALTMWAPPFAIGQGKPKEETATKADYKLLENVKEIEGELTALESSTKQMTLKAGYEYLEPNPNYRPNAKANARFAGRVNRLINQQQRALAMKNPVKRIQKLQQLSADMQVLQLQAPVGPPPFRPAMAYKDVEADATETVVVRRLNLPMEYDDKGNVKEYTEKEKKELRGKDPKVPGYAASWDDVGMGQKVKLYLKSKKAIDKAKKSLADKDAADADKDAPKAANDAAKGADKDKAPEDKAKAEDAEKEPRVHAFMILIEADPDPAATPATPRKKKRQNN